MPGLALNHAVNYAPPPQAVSQASSQVAAPAASTSGSNWDFSFHNILGVINPLQHLPVIGTLYRAITGDKIGTPEKIAGDALYGGLWGAVSSVADTAFEAATGKDFGDTMIGMVTGGDKSGAVAANSNAPGHKDFGGRLLALFNGDDNATAVAANDAMPDFGDRLLAFFSGKTTNATAVASTASPTAPITGASVSSSPAAKPRPVASAPGPATPPGADVVALTTALAAKAMTMTRRSVP